MGGGGRGAGVFFVSPELLPERIIKKKYIYIYIGVRAVVY